MTLSIDEITSPGLVALGLDVSDRWAAIDAMADLLQADGRLTDRDAFVATVRQREEHGPTGMEMGIAIPHGKSPGVAQTSVVFARVDGGVDFGAPDGTPADLLFLIAAPDSGADDHLTVLSRLARRLVHEEFRDALRNAQSTQDVISVIHREVTI